jgi:hypothetical protein
MRAVSVNFKITAKEVKDMAKFLILWRVNPMATPPDTVERVKVNEMLWAMIDNMMKTGEIREEGFFLNGTSGYILVEGEPADVFKVAASFRPFVDSEVHEILPYETGKEVVRGVMKANAEATKK